MKTGLDNPIFTDETKARDYLEALRWPDGPVCPHCGVVGEAIKLPKTDKVRNGVYKCKPCRKQFTVTVGTLFERSHIPLNKWLLAVHLLCASKKGHSSHQIHRMLGITYKSAWFMTHRIREAMRDPVFVTQLGGPGKIVEADETYWGHKGRSKTGAPWAHKEKIFSLVERGGKVRSFHVETVGAKTLKPIMREQIAKESAIMTDGANCYYRLSDEFSSHGTVDHQSGEYVRGAIHVNTLECFFSIMKRGLSGVYQHVGAGHLKRYIGEFDFRFNHRNISDEDRTVLALRGIAGKRLLYTRPW